MSILTVSMLTFENRKRMNIMNAIRFFRDGPADRTQSTFQSF